MSTAPTRTTFSRQGATPLALLSRPQRLGAGRPAAPIRVLLIEDCRATFEVTRTDLEAQSGSTIELHWAPTLKAALSKLLPSETFDAVLLDFHLPDAEGLDALRKIQTAAPKIPVLFLTVNEDQETARAAVRAGAQEYLVKSRVQGESIARAVAYAIGRQAVQNELERAHRERLTLMYRLLSQVSHEMRTPLASVHQFSTILLDGLAGQVNAEQKEYLEIIVAGIHRLTKLTQDLLESSRAESGKLQLRRRPVDVGAAFEAVLEAQEHAAASRGVSLSATVSAGLPPVAADPIRLEQVVTNLVDNAIKFAPGGKVSLQAVAIGESLVQISVVDDGRGIAPQNLDRVFARLYQEKPGDDHATPGLGLGLHICRQLVESHGGRIRAESTLGEGSAFRFTLPQARPTLGPEHRPRPTPTTK